MEINLVAESIKFMFLGMGVVFAFLTIMIFVLKAQGAILTRFFPQKEKIVSVVTTPVKANNTNVETAKIAAIVAAVQHHKNLKG
ncbi:oxaloacetate decarboxylase, gamma subunit [Arcobacter venerupis]|uniref:Probable oxaloacetate decarboxylase gamma chain n=1 Tax=Arcobacter venerupis TaxID=1054033 RepID=A0AAE7BB63_9BACT|nr:OadG family transporter subunit [Arcobacter venerupis]QKF65868.1 oxaloacetate decarboxylase, gamma subunit [Arcobacter venerupis]QKF67142.1 oxaloacetate decarboxylase, gamma subunit [Arcobacter venerupis]RWS48137.1 sodium pump decarboxylase subunit gamma [Arcobacter venerupis]